MIHQHLYIEPDVTVPPVQQQDVITSAVSIKNKAKMDRRKLRKKELVTIDSKDYISCISIVITSCSAVFIDAIKNYHADRRGRTQSSVYNKTPEGIEAASRKKARQDSGTGGIAHNGNHSVTQSHHGGRTPNHRINNNLRIEVDDESESSSDEDKTKDMIFDSQAKLGWNQKLLYKVCCSVFFFCNCLLLIVFVVVYFAVR